MKRRPDRTVPLDPEVLLYPWLTIASDLFQFNGTDYLPLVNYMSRFPVICKLTSQTSKSVSEQMKSVFSEYGVPDTIILDNEPHYDSK